ncbi:FixH family protein [Endozoicomonas sp. SM1973]|uniref:FixH family protein n=1 Tax=Spartinivicinus marinus TaxID=2994442 RepID=A0A853I6B7_9GAMM|nr:FixH family protein [Spartinivicinus marinus]MCX4029533.1 FixH family protein [Spartinivicinus marinus]NYZ65107.1 FixH family protein [Spartinivicinus marinus]
MDKKIIKKISNFNKLAVLLVSYSLFCFAVESKASELINNSDIIKIANELILDARKQEMASMEIISRANQIRKEVNSLRATARTLTDKSLTQQLTVAADLLAEQVTLWQQQGADNRQKSSDYFSYGRQLLTKAFKEQWQAKIKLDGEIALIPSTQPLIAHNTQIRSVHPNMPKAMQDTGSAVSGMTLSVPSLSAQSIPSPLDTASFQLSRDINFFSHVEPIVDVSQQQPMVPLNQIHQWRLMLSDLAAQPVSGKAINVRGHMPGHVHGLPTQPRVTKEIEPGVYLIEGMKFQMIGWWVIEFDIPYHGGVDTIKFNVVL